MATLTQLIADYQAGPKLLRQATTGFTREQALAKPIHGKMGTLEVVCHLADFEPIYADRMKRVIAEEKPTIIGADEMRFLAALSYDQRDLEEEVRIIELTRSQMARILGCLDPKALTRQGLHNERGPMTLEALLGYTTAHIPHHVQFILDKRKALGI